MNVGFKRIASLLERIDQRDREIVSLSETVRYLQIALEREQRDMADSLQNNLQIQS